MQLAQYYRLPLCCQVEPFKAYRLLYVPSALKLKTNLHAVYIAFMFCTDLRTNSTFSLTHH